MTKVCGLTTATYTVAATSGATSFKWTLPTGITCSLGASPVTIPVVTSGSNTITVNIDPTFISGTLSVMAVNSCSMSLAKTLAISKLLSAPTTLTGIVTGLCPSGVSSTVYTCGAVAGASSYLWIAPTGATITAGQGTTSATISFGATFTSGNISVQALNACGNSLLKTLAIKSTLATPTLTSTLTTGLCPSGVASATYTCGTVTGATSYLWTLPTGATITAGAGTTAVTISFGASFVSGSISVQAQNACGNSAAKVLAVRSILLPPATLTGITTGLCPSGIASTTYTCATVAGATSYLWTVPTGATITAGAGTTAATISFGATFTTGNISVQAVNACGNSTAKVLAVHSTLLAPATLTGQTTGLCVAGTSTATYTCAAVTGATSYVWTIPSGATLTSGAGTTSVVVTFGASFTSGSITVKGINACGNGLTKTLVVNSTLLSPGIIAGTTAVCANSTGNTYSILPVTGATSYLWTVPAGATITSGAGTTSIVVDFGTTVTTGITVKGVNACGNGLARTLTLAMTCMGTHVTTDKSMIDNNAVLNTIELYPNPTSDNLNINLTSDSDKEVVIEIFNTLGSRVSSIHYSLTVGENLLNTKVSDFMNGVYFVHVTDLSTFEVQNKTFIKQ